MNKYNVASAALKRRRRAAGLCTECGGPRQGRKLRCPDCVQGRKVSRSSAWLCPQAADPRFRPAMTQAFERGIKWTLTEEEFTAARDAPCVYCGADSTGLDRDDPNQGYEPGNVAACCQMCNCAKNVLSGAEWRRIIGPAVERLGRGNVWPTQNRYPSEEKRAQRDGVVAAWPFCTLVATIGTWSSAVLEESRLEALIAERERLGLDEYGRTKGQIETEHRIRREAVVANKLSYQMDHEARGLCKHCPRPVLEGKKVCEGHKLYERERGTLEYWKDGKTPKAHCGVCGVKGHNSRRCPEKGVLSPSAIPEWKRETRNSWERGWWLKRTEERRAQGLCIKCGEAPMAAGISKCDGCREPLEKREMRTCRVCGGAFEATAGALKRTCGPACIRAVASFRGDARKRLKIKDSWPEWKKEIWRSVHAGARNAVTDEAA
jgi:hypothetical protein